MIMYFENKLIGPQLAIISLMHTKFVMLKKGLFGKLYTETEIIDIKKSRYPPSHGIQK